MWIPTLTVLFVLIVALLSIRFGGEPEKYGAWVCGGTLALSILARMVVPPTLASVDPVGVTIDLIAFAGFTAIALRAWRIWPLWASSLQLLALAAHFIRLLELEIHPVVYALMRAGPTYLGTLALLCGTIGSWRRNWRLGEEQPWRTW